MDFSGVILSFVERDRWPQEIHRENSHKNPCQNPRSQNEISSTNALQKNSPNVCFAPTSWKSLKSVLIAFAASSSANAWDVSRLAMIPTPKVHLEVQNGASFGL